ncbi:MAG: hypothetical protein Q4F99_04120 [bacterium]|nr:hypothetical protein [bacterium]
MKKALFLAMIALSTGLFVAGCGSTPPKRIQAGGTQALTTMGINIQDFKRVASSLTQAMLNNQNVTGFEAKNGRKPVIAVGSIKKSTTTRIDFAQIEGRINEDLLNSGLVEIVAVDDTSIFVSGGSTLDADFFLEGTITEKTEIYDGVGEKTYTFQLRLNSSNMRTIFQKTEDVAKQGSKADLNSGW